MQNVYRFSKDGFIRQHQSFHLNGISPEFLSQLNLSKLTIFGKMLYRREVANIREWRNSVSLSDFEFGIWLFIGERDMLYINQQLNHISKKHRTMKKWFIGSIDDDAYLYTSYGTGGKQVYIRNLVCGDCAGYYCPENQIQYIENIKVLEF